MCLLDNHRAALHERCQPPPRKNNSRLTDALPILCCPRLFVIRDNNIFDELAVMKRGKVTLACYPDKDEERNYPAPIVDILAAHNPFI